MLATAVFLAGCGGTTTSSSVATSGPSSPVIAGQTVQLSGFLTGASSFASVTFAIQTNPDGSPTGGGGTVTVDGKYTAPLVINPAKRSQVVVVTSKADPSKTGLITVPLGYAIASITPAGIDLSVNRTVTFSATVAGDPSATLPADTRARVTWSVSGLGLINPTSGLYTAPVSAADGTVVTIKATSTADPTVSSTVTLTLRSAGGIVVIA